MNQLERLHFIYQLLEIEPRNVQDICKELAQKGFTTAKRQIYKDLEQLEKNY
jgi:Fe2+ or Zn2+ uptake regulation protein